MNVAHELSECYLSPAGLSTAVATRHDASIPASFWLLRLTSSVAALLARGLAHEKLTESPGTADAALKPFWRNLDDGRGVLLRIGCTG